MRHQISPLRHALDCFLDLLGVGPRRSRLTPARNPETRLRFAQYVSRIQPVPDPSTVRRTARLLAPGGAVSNGIVKHARGEDNLTPRQPRFSMFSQPGNIVALRRSRAHSHTTPLRSLLDAFRVR